jgi:hypothetical protein
MTLTPACPLELSTPSMDRVITSECLQEHLQWALELEHCTIPPYLCALYSLDPDRNPAAAEVVASVVVEEMLHMTLVANLLNAVGGQPRLDAPRMLPGYPRRLPHSDGSFDVPLQRFCPEALNTFLKIEQPSAPCALPKGEQYESIGQFYSAIRHALICMCAQVGETNVFSGDPARQVSDTGLYSGGGTIISVNNLDSALIAITEIVDQGEGAQLDIWDGEFNMIQPEREEVAHYFRFQELNRGRRYRLADSPESGPTGDALTIDWDGVYPMRTNLRISDHAADSPIRLAQDEFNRTYCAILRGLEHVFNGNPEQLEPTIGAMYGLKERAVDLMRMPNEDAVTTAGPTFEYFVQHGPPYDDGAGLLG